MTEERTSGGICLKDFYAKYTEAVARAKSVLKRPITFTEKVLYAHLWGVGDIKNYERGADYVNFAPDRVAMQDATAQMAMLQFINAGRKSSAVPATIHCDHLIQANAGAAADLAVAEEGNREVYQFLRSAAAKFGMGFWPAGAGIIHQVVLENYAFPGGMMVGTDSHTPNAGGLGMAAVGVGGADAVDVMTGLPWELKMPKIIGVRLTGRLSGWTFAKDVILRLAGILTVKGATNCVIEYFGEGAGSLSATGKATICNMGAEVGATCSLFPFDESMAAYLRATGRAEAAGLAVAAGEGLRADPEVLEDPESFYDRVIEIDLSALAPHVNGPFTPDAAHPAETLGDDVKAAGWPEKVEAVLIGSCTNSSFEDLYAMTSVLKNAREKGIRPRVPLIVNPGSVRILRTLEKYGMTEELRIAGATIMANACGPCIGQWKRRTDDPTRRNSIVTTFNRNFAKRADGNPNTHAFIASPAMAAALALAGTLGFDPRHDAVEGPDGSRVTLSAPDRMALPDSEFAEAPGKVRGEAGGEIAIDPQSERIQKLEPFPALDPAEFIGMPLLIKAAGKCTTDHISMAGPWLRYRGHLENISRNLLMGAVNAFTGETDSVLDPLTGGRDKVSAVAKRCRDRGIGTFVVAEENYGEGSSREHAAMEPRYLNVKVIIAKSFARIHETNLKKQGVLALTFADKADYEKVRETDRLSIPGVDLIEPWKPLELKLFHADGTCEEITAIHTCNAQQIAWFRAGSALNFLKSREAAAN